MAKQATKAKRAPSYSADSIALRIIGGLVLVALGVLMFLSVAVQLDSFIFQYIRQITFGLGGTLGILLPIYLVWGGVLLVLSTRTRQNQRPFWMAIVLFLVLTAAMTLFSRTAYNGRAVPLLDVWANDSSGALTGSAPDAYETYLYRAYRLGATKHVGGGAAGMLLSWPLWRLVGSTFGGVLCILLIPVVIYFLLPWDLQQWKEHLNAFTSKWRARQSQSTQEQNQRDARFRTEELRRKQMEEEAARAAEQQNAPQQNWRTHPAYTQRETVGFTAKGDERYTTVQGGQPHVETISQPGTQPQAENKVPFMSRIFGKKPAADGQQPAFVRTPRGQQETAPVSTPQVNAAQTAGWGRKQPTATPENNWQPPQQVPVQESTDGYYSDYEAPPVELLPEQPLETNGYPTQNEAQYEVNQAATAETAATKPPQAETSRGSRRREHRAGQNAAHTEATVQTATQPAAAATPSQRAAAEAARSAANRAARTAGTTQPAAQTDWQRQLAERMEQSGMNEAGASQQPQQKQPKPLQKPKPSWTNDADRPPWEEPPAKEDHEVRVPFTSTMTYPGTVDPADGPMMVPQEEKRPIRPYTYPSAMHLANAVPPIGNQAEQDANRAAILEETLESFGVTAQVENIVHGPAVSRFELSIARGIRVNRVSGLDKDIAMKLAVPNVRVQAPIPGKTLVGIEVPNSQVTPVVLREVMLTDVMKKSLSKSRLSVALGKDISGQPIVCDLERMPHLLIAGATGSGKSVCINSIIISLLYQTTPQEVRMIMIDPKVVELKPFNGIPHLLLPVVNDPHKAAGALQWSVNEMMERYEKFAERNVRNIAGYNSTLQEGEEPMPRIVIIIDELADLMVVCKKDVESHIQRLTQLARAAGMHLIIATQRPSVNVITGVIKANIPSRIAFKTTSQIDSRTILDHMGAEGLIGRGDMLYFPTGTFAPTRVQGCFLKDEEVESVVEDILAHNDTNYDEKISEILEETATAAGDAPDSYSGSGTPAESNDSMLINAIEITVQDGQVSTSMLQRRLSLGYARAARIVDRMEELGIVSQKDGAKPRYCLIDRERFEEMKSDGTLG